MQEQEKEIQQAAGVQPAEEIAAQAAAPEQQSALETEASAAEAAVQAEDAAQTPEQPRQEHLLGDVEDYGAPDEWNLGTYGTRSRQELTDQVFAKINTDEKITVKDYVLANMALQDAKMEAGIKDEESYKGFFGLLKRYQDWKEHRPRHKVNKKKYLLLLVFLGWMGGHRYYEKRYILAAVYTLFFWTCLPLCSCLVDAMIAIPIKADENGDILI